ncbi:DUF4010 domain-containing protein [Nocardia sp. NRRL S-836]|uniref:DUF4010 domain-containing protein n=1 Tax=Nocardia sp. NRRL S-836 TaxID=1519492 RepID=UPI0006AEC1B0|nr:DUF4010 domain-containing protein [Nocardia sp. NRRL S-836]
MRTFPLIALTGAVSAALSPVALGVALGAVAALVIAWYRLELAVPVGAAAAVLLAAKRPLHRFARKVMSDQDVRDAMILFVVAFVVLPLLPTGRSARTTAIAGPSVALRLLPAVGAGAVVLLAEVAWLVWRTKPAETENDDPLVGRPMSQKDVLSLAAVLVLFLVLTRAAAEWLGGGGVVAAGGLADAHATAIAAASLAPRSIPVHVVVLACGAALGTNTVVELVLAAISGGPRCAFRLAAWLLPVVVAVAPGMAR